MRTVFLGDIDITKYVFSVPPVAESAGEYGQLVTNEIQTIEGNAINKFWDTTAPESPFFGVIDITKLPITIKQDDVITFLGTIQNISINNQERKAIVNLRSDIQKILESKIVYVSDPEGDTPANIAREICSLYKIPINDSTFNISHGIYNSNSIVISANYPKAEKTVIDALQEIANVGIAKIYSCRQKLNFEVYYSKDSEALYTASDKHDNTEGITLLSHPLIEPIEKEKTTGYRIEYLGTTPAIVGNDDEQGISIDGSYNSSVRIHTLQSAVWIGDAWLDYLNNNQNNITFALPSEIGKSLVINAGITIEYRDNTYLVDIISIDNSSKVLSTIIGVTR